MKAVICFRILLSILIYTAANLLACIALPQSFSLLLCTGIGALAALPLLCFLYGREQARREPPVFAQQRFCTVPSVMLLAFSACLAFNGLITLLHIPDLFSVYGDSIQETLYAPAFAEQLLCTVLVIPAAEELIFRGHAFCLIRDQSRFSTAAVLSALLFALYHGNMVQGVYAFLMGLVAAWLMETYRNLRYPYLFHAAANLVSVSMTRFLPLDWQTPKPVFLLAETLLAFAFAAGCMRRISSRLTRLGCGPDRGAGSGPG